MTKRLGMKQEVYYSSEDLEQGIDGLPSISTVTLRNLRSSKKIKYTRIGRKTYYKKEWIEAYINSNIRSAKNNNMENTYEK
jgi:hypothetical protein